MAQKHSTGHGHRGNFKCDMCLKPQQFFAQKENLDRHIRVFHYGGVMPTGK